MQALLFVVICAVVACAFAQDLHQIGFGVTRLQKSTQKHGLTLEAKSTTNCEDVEPYWFTGAIQDNFAPADKKEVWAKNENGQGQRYWINRKFWAGENAPIFVFIGGEGEESCTRLSDHLYLYELAKEHNAMLVDVEHRFYGESLPTEDRSTKNLALLSSDQALADLANVITYIKEKNNSPKSRVITVGGSYPGNLAAYFRLKYPSITHGSIASSAPVTAKANFKEYMDVVGESITYFGGKQCYNALELGAQQVAKLASAGFGSENMKTLEKDFNTCAPIADQWDMGIFSSNVMGNLQGTVQYNNERTGVWNVTDVCEVMLGSNSSTAEAPSQQQSYLNLAKLSAIFAKQGGADCEDASYKATIDYLASTNADPSNAARPWVYQTCNEFGYYQTADSPNQPFHAFQPWLGMDFSRKMCYDAFDGWSSDPDTKFTNEKYGGSNMDATNIVFTSGTIDPWHALGVTNYTAPLPEAPSELPVYILGTAHCKDLSAPSWDDPASLTYAREVVAKKFNQWLHTDTA